MNVDVTRLVATIAIWLIIAMILINVAVFDSSKLDEQTALLGAAAVASMYFIWHGYGRQREQERIARLKRNEGLARRLAAEEDLDEDDIVSLEELLEEQRASRRPGDR